MAALRRYRSVLFALAVSAIACSDGADPPAAPLDVGSDVSGSETDVDASDALPDLAADALPTTFTSVYATLYAICVDCHRAEEGPKGDLALDAKYVEQIRAWIAAGAKDE